jgi:hypothetical protein
MAHDSVAADVAAIPARTGGHGARDIPCAARPDGAAGGSRSHDRSARAEDARRVAQWAWAHLATIIYVAVAMLVIYLCR